MVYQVFIEPKGAHLFGLDKRTEQKTIQVQTDTYLITAVPFYNYNFENDFKKTLESTLGA